MANEQAYSNALKRPNRVYILGGCINIPLNLRPIFRNCTAIPNKLAKEPQTTLLETFESQLQKSIFTLEELQVSREDELPWGVDADKLPEYLNDEDFHQVMGIARSEFEGLSSAKKHEMTESGIAMIRVLKPATIS